MKVSYCVREERDVGARRWKERKRKWRGGGGDSSSFISSDTFAQDFFLTYPAFMSISDLCEGLRKRYDGVIVKRSGDTPASSSTEQVKVRKRR